MSTDKNETTEPVSEELPDTPEKDDTGYKDEPEKSNPEKDVDVVTSDGDAQAFQPPTVTLQDLQSLVNFIDIVSERGGVKGNELKLVGTLRANLVDYLNYVTSQQAE